MTINKRLERLEQLATQATQEGDGLPDIVINLSWEDPQPIMVDGQPMTRGEIDRRWPGWWKRNQTVVNLGWKNEH